MQLHCMSKVTVSCETVKSTTRTEDMAVFTDSSGKGMISTDFKCASHGAVDVLIRTVFRTASEEMSTKGINRGMVSAGAVHTGWD